MKNAFVSLPLASHSALPLWSTAAGVASMSERGKAEWDAKGKDTNAFFI